nr:hypothetical protein [uncultured Sphaerochaeta sp.]
MRSLAEIIDERIRSQVAAPVLARVDKAYVKAATGGYCIDATVLVPGSLEATGELLKEVPLSPIWAGKDGRGIYAPPEEGTVVVVSFIASSKAWPFVGAVYGEQVKPCSDAAPASLVICDGKGAHITLAHDGKITIANGGGTLKALLDEILDLCGALKANGTDTRGDSVITTSMEAGTAAGIKAKVAALLGG